MNGFGFGGNNCCLWILIILLILCFCGNGMLDCLFDGCCLPIALLVYCICKKGGFNCFGNLFGGCGCK